MRNGTQEELDAAREDATLLPFDAVFVVNDTGSYGKDCDIFEGLGCRTGVHVFRVKGHDDSSSFGFAPIGFDAESSSLRTHMDASDLEVVK